MSNKLALITGANKGIGLETVRQLAPLGYTVLLAARDKAKGEAAALQLQSEGLDVHFLPLDVNAQADINATVAFLETNYNGTLDVLINNAGVNYDETWGKQGVSGTPNSDLRKTFETNVFAVHALTVALLPALKKSAAGRIVNLSSILGSVSLNATPGSPIYEMKSFAYNTSKAALNMFTICLAAELKNTNIKVNSAHPGWVKTDMGGDAAPMDIPDGAKTSVKLATLPADGPTGGFFHMDDTLPW